MKPYCVIVLAVVMGGCANQYIWYKDGATQQDLTEDRYACLQQAQRVSGAPVSPSSPYRGAPQDTAQPNPQLFNACMNNRGYELRPAPQ
jgi:hypothetical protein